MEDIDNELISSSLIKNRMIDSQDEGEYSTEGDVGPSALGDYVAEGDDYTEEYDEYPIIDMFGDIISYGTKEESEKSFQDYDEQPYYTVMSCDMFYNTAVFKVFNKGESKIQVYEVSLNGSKQMDSYIILDIKGWELMKRGVLPLIAVSLIAVFILVSCKNEEDIVEQEIIPEEIQT